MLNKITKRHALSLGLLSLLISCNAQDISMDEDICEAAALHREHCTGEYITPPVCDEAAQRQAEQVLSVPCEEFDTAFPDSGKADGAFCDWFGAGCTPDEEIFTGPPCSTDEDCSDNLFCVENRCFAGVLSDEFSASMDKFTSTTESRGSYVVLHVDNDETRQLRVDLMNNALHSIHFTSLLIEDNESGRETIVLLIAAAARGVEVRVVVDATSQYFSSDYSMLRELSEGGVKTIAFNPINEWASVRLLPEYWRLTANMRLHEKILVIDGAEAVLGGRNVGDSYMAPDRWRDADVYVTGPGVGDIQEMFLLIWNRAFNWERRASCRSASRYGHWCPPDDKSPVGGSSYFPFLDQVANAGTRPIHSDPYSQETAHGYITTLALVRAARSSIKISAAYFIPPRRLRKHLRAAAERGVDVTVVTNSKESTDFTTMYYASLNYYKELIGAGVRIYEYNGVELLHSKVMLIDDEMAVVGSYNLDPRSAIDNSETMMLIRRCPSVVQLKRAIEEDIAGSTLASDDIPMSDMILARAARITEPLL